MERLNPHPDLYRTPEVDASTVEPTFYSEERRFAIRKAIESPNFIHARTRKWCGWWDTSIYHTDSKSPSGVIRVEGGPDSLVTEELRRAGKTSPLSPTEGL